MIASWVVTSAAASVLAGLPARLRRLLRAGLLIAALRLVRRPGLRRLRGVTLSGRCAALCSSVRIRSSSSATTRMQPASSPVSASVRAPSTICWISLRRSPERSASATCRSI